MTKFKTLLLLRGTDTHGKQTVWLREPRNRWDRSDRFRDAGPLNSRHWVNFVIYRTTYPMKPWTQR